MRFTWLSTNDKNGGGPWQSGWKEHAITLEDGEDESHTSPVSLGKRAALCGLRPRHGWGIDLFIDKRCKRCERAYMRAMVECPKCSALMSNGLLESHLRDHGAK